MRSLSRSADAARNRKSPAKRSFRGVCPRVFEMALTVSHRPYHKGLTLADRDVSLKVIVGTDGGLDTSIETPLGNFDWEFFHHDETSEAK